MIETREDACKFIRDSFDTHTSRQRTLVCVRDGCFVRTYMIWKWGDGEDAYMHDMTLYVAKAIGKEPHTRNGRDYIYSRGRAHTDPVKHVVQELSTALYGMPTYISYQEL